LSQPVGDNLLFFGFKLIRKKDDNFNPINFALQHEGQWLNSSFVGAQQRLDVFYFCFITTVNCNSDQYFNSTDGQCVTCMNGTYPGNGTCEDCGTTYHPNCTHCDASACLTCDSPYKLNATTCFLCGEVWANCTQCSLVTGCTQCDSSFGLNSTSALSPCFLCSH
jgi:hypothetical protein